MTTVAPMLRSGIKRSTSYQTVGGGELASFAAFTALGYIAAQIVEVTADLFKSIPEADPVITDAAASQCLEAQ